MPQIHNVTKKHTEGALLKTINETFHFISRMTERTTANTSICDLPNHYKLVPSWQQLPQAKVTRRIFNRWPECAQQPRIWSDQF